MKVRFLEEWPPYRKGDVADIVDSFAINDLLPRKMVEVVEEEEKATAPRGKQTKAATKNKMVTEAANKSEAG